MGVPSRIIAGDSLSFTVAGGDALASDGWTASLALRRASGDGIDLESEANGDDHAFVVDAADTAEWQAGRYWYDLRVTDGTLVRTIARGQLDVEASLADVEQVDRRSHVERTLEAIEALLANRATLDQQRYRIGDRELERMRLDELLTWRDKYRAELVRMQRRDSGRGPLRMHQVVFR